MLGSGSTRGSPFVFISHEIQSNRSWVTTFDGPISVHPCYLLVFILCDLLGILKCLMGAVSKVTPWLPALSSELWLNSPFLSCHSVLPLRRPPPVTPPIDGLHASVSGMDLMLKESPRGIDFFPAYFSLFSFGSPASDRCVCYQCSKNVILLRLFIPDQTH